MTSGALINRRKVFGLGESITLLLPGSRIFGRDVDDSSQSELKTGLKVNREYRHTISNYIEAHLGSSWNMRNSYCSSFPSCSANSPFARAF